MPFLFPQHGPGPKHARKVELLPWQYEITRRFTREFLRGLIHSDGSRCINRFSVKLPSGRIGRYAYPRYFFTNLSADIRGIFCEHCELLGIRWTQSNPRNISISHRGSVAILDSFVARKRDTGDVRGGSPVHRPRARFSPEPVPIMAAAAGEV